MKNPKIITENDEWFLKLKAEAEKISARVYLIPKLTVDYTRPFNESLMAGGPQTGLDYDIFKHADEYQPSENKVTDEVIVLFNLINGLGRYQKTIEWGLQNSLQRTTPHVPFAIGEQKPNLNYELGHNYMCVAETTGCQDIACLVEWDNNTRRCFSLFKGYLVGSKSEGVWFAFRKKIIPPLQSEGTIAGSYGGC